MPAFLTEFSLDKVAGVVRVQLTDDQPIKEELLELQMLLESGEIDDDEYVEREARIMAALRDVRHWREQYGMGLSGGPVRVAAKTEEEKAQEEEEGEPRQPHAFTANDASFDIQLNFDDE